MDGEMALCVWLIASFRNVCGRETEVDKKKSGCGNALWTFTSCMCSSDNDCLVVQNAALPPPATSPNPLATAFLMKARRGGAAVCMASQWQGYPSQAALQVTVLCWALYGRSDGLVCVADCQLPECLAWRMRWTNRMPDVAMALYGPVMTLVNEGCIAQGEKAWW